MRFAAVIVVVAAAAAQLAPPSPRPTAGPPPRDPIQRAEPAGTAAIRGRVVAADTGNAIRRANVNLLPMFVPGSAAGRGAVPPGNSSAPSEAAQILRGTAPVVRPRSAVTDSQGTFAFAGLPAGRYQIAVSPAQYAGQYVGMAYGAKSATGPFMRDLGTPIALAEGQTFDKVTIALPRGAVIAGRVTDENGDPLVRVQVYTLLFSPGLSRGQRTGGGTQTDDLGQFRLYGLAAGDYAVAAEARGVNYVGPNAQPESDEDKIGFMTTYYPGATDDAGAQRVRVRTGAETSGIEIRMVQGRLFHVSGLVTDSQGRIAARTDLQLASRVAGGGGFFGASTDEQGQFQMRNIPPGSYRVIVRQIRQSAGRGMSGAPVEPGEMASVPLTIAGDVDNLTIMTGPGAAIGGHVVFEQGPPTGTLPSTMRVSAMLGNPEDSAGSPSPEPATLTPEFAFTMKGLMGEVLLRAFVPNQFVKSVTVNGEEITDTPHEFKTNDRVTLTLTSRASTLEGSVTDAAGGIAADAGVIVFSEDKALWRTNSTRTRRAPVDADGHFRVTGLMPGRYWMAATSRARVNVPQSAADQEFFEQLSKEATAVVLGEDEQRKIDLSLITNR
ncbi:MAG: carboxypeptidase regulatory-like domain-containing protein [Acidobacteriota bacterium]